MGINTWGEARQAIANTISALDNALKSNCFIAAKRVKIENVEKAKTMFEEILTNWDNQDVIKWSEGKEPDGWIPGQIEFIGGENNLILKNLSDLFYANISNAWRYMPNGGMISINTNYSSTYQIRVDKVRDAIIDMMAHMYKNTGGIW